MTPIEHSRAYRDRSGARVVLHEVDDEHALRWSTDLLAELVLSMAGDLESPRTDR